jgi:hypothetical protein
VPEYTRDTDYPINDDNSVMKIANFNGVGGGTIALLSPKALKRRGKSVTRRRRERSRSGVSRTGSVAPRVARCTRAPPTTINMPLMDGLMLLGRPCEQQASVNFSHV